MTVWRMCPWVVPSMNSDQSNPVEHIEYQDMNNP